MKYKIWNKQDPIITPSGAVYTAEQWMEKYPVAKMDIEIVCSDSELNGSYFGILSSLVEEYIKLGADFSSCSSSNDKILVINEFIEQQEIKRSEIVESHISNEELSATSLAAIAASLEYQNLTTLDDIEEVESDIDGNVSQGVAKVSGNVTTILEDGLSPQGERISAHLESGLWSIPMVKVAVRKGVITKDEFQSITGNEYK